MRFYSDSEPQPSGRFPLWCIIKPVRGQIIFSMTLAGLAALTSLGALLFLVWSLHQLCTFPAVLPLFTLTGTVVCVLLTCVIRLAAFNLSHYAAFRLEKVLRITLARQSVQLPLGKLQQMGSGALTKVIQDDVKSLHIFVADSTPLFARAIVMPLATSLLLLWLDWRLALTALAILVVGIVVLLLARRSAGSLPQRYHQTREQVSAAIVEFVQAMPVVRTFDNGSSSFMRYQQALEEWVAVLKSWYRRAQFSARFSFSILNPLPGLLALVWLAYGLMRHNSLDIPAWVAVLLLCSGMAESVMPVMTLSHLVAQTRLSVQRINQLLALPGLPQPTCDRQPADASVTFDKVSFHYPQSREVTALSEVSFHLPAGKIIALVGPSGAGKSTVARLLLRFADVSEGQIRIGGIDIRDMRTSTLMQQLSFVFQDNFLFADSIANNICLGMPECSPEAVIAAAKVAQADDFISALPRGYNTPVGERGVFLSGGQRQRITIARAILQNRPILVLDEATAFADPENEVALVKALSAAMRGKTVIMVAHRLSMVTQADQILVFSQGRLVGSGEHKALLSQGGFYQRLWQQYQQAQRWTADGAGTEAGNMSLKNEKLA